ncbi:TonB-dependent receptor [Fischerella thermalis CCMEE 5198]|jgi:vitamin B12 transporter|uniref:TonB-dependent receptor plug domain-containing protein n=1 Tax=Fischerella thermalis TaxID=372787 RepID=UPI000C806B08|nr:TonB-dependent receptor [Fischerella thermalis]PMB24771.1 TonB-dependent receptor [Fischerella thermalis CCMEE 5198]PMB50348.1 TonB-dependent receptor [Fischerella thermalis CCMEE 5201]
MRNQFIARWGTQLIVSSLTITAGMLWENSPMIATEVLQISEFPQEEGSAKDLQPFAEVISQDTTENEPDIELTVIDKLLNEPVFSPFRREGTVKDSTRPVYVITGEEMEAQGARTVREALRFLPGILGDGTVGTEVNALSSQFIRGSNTAQVLILLDGRPINNLGGGGFDLSEFTTNNIERVEVLPGGGSTLYGSDAIGGVINIVTRRPTEQITTETKVNFGSYGLNQQIIQNSGKSGDISWVVGYNRTQAQNNYRFRIPEANFEGTRRNNDALYNNFNVKLEANLGKRNTLTLSTLYLGKEQGVPGGVPIPFPQFGQGFFNSLTENNRKYTDQVLTDLTWNSKLGSGDDSLLTARVYADFLNTRFDNRSGAITSQNRFDTKQNSYGIQVTHNWNIAKNQTLVYGFDYRNTNVRNTTFNYGTNITRENYDDAIGQGAIFGKYEINFSPSFSMNLGVRQDFSSLVNGSFTSPSVGVKLAVSDSTTLRANYIRNFRTPTIANLFNNNPTNIGNPDLKPEKGDSFDVGIDQKLGNIGLLRLTFFSNRVSDTIAFKRLIPPVNGNTGTWENIGLVKTTGIEASLNLQLARNVYAFVNYTANDPRILASANPAEVGKELRFVGADKLNLGVSYENPQGWYFGVLMNSLSGYPTNNINTEFLPGYTTFDLKMRVPISDSLVLTGSLDNLFDQRYQLFPGFPDGGRVFQVGLSSRF